MIFRAALLSTALLLMLASCGKSSTRSVGNQPKEVSAVKDLERGMDAIPHEYRVGLFMDAEFDPGKITHIILVGSAMKTDSDQFFQSGLSRAYRYKEVWPSHQVAILSTPDVINRSDEQVFQKYKVKVVKKVVKLFTATQLIEEMAAFSRIASFDYFGHSSPWALKIDSLNAPFDPSAHFAALAELRKNFLPEAFATLNGCNTGFYIAPDLSRALEIPVSGSLTSSMFERIEADGHWYKEEDWNWGGYIDNNRFSYDQKYSCSLGVCNRMKSSRDNYSSIWGTFKEGGLSFDKFFCNYNDTGDGRCERGMAMSLMGFPSVRAINLASKVEDYKQVVFDWLCSTGGRRSYFQNCVAGIKEAVQRQDLIFRSHSSNELNCDFHSCNARVTCAVQPGTDLPTAGTCRLITIPNARPTNVAREFLSLLKGFEQIRE